MFNSRCRFVTFILILPPTIHPPPHLPVHTIIHSDLGSYEAGSPNLDGPSTGENSQRYPIDSDASAARYAIIYPKKTTLKRRLRVNDEEFLDFVSTLLSVDPTLRCGSKWSLAV